MGQETMKALLAGSETDPVAAAERALLESAQQEAAAIYDRQDPVSTIAGLREVLTNVEQQFFRAGDGVNKLFAITKPGTDEPMYSQRSLSVALKGRWSPSYLSKLGSVSEAFDAAARTAALESRARWDDCYKASVAWEKSGKVKPITEVLSVHLQGKPKIKVSNGPDEIEKVLDRRASSGEPEQRLPAVYVKHLYLGARDLRIAEEKSSELIRRLREAVDGSKRQEEKIRRDAIAAAVKLGPDDKLADVDFNTIFAKVKAEKLNTETLDDVFEALEGGRKLREEFQLRFEAEKDQNKVL